MFIKNKLPHTKNIYMFRLDFPMPLEPAPFKGIVPLFTGKF